MRLSLAQYRELEAFAQFASDLDDTTRKQLERGQRMMEVLKQPQYHPLTVAEMALSIFAVDKGYMDDVEVKRVVAFEHALLDYFRSSHQSLLDQLNRESTYDDKVEKQLHHVIKTFKETHSW